MKNLSDVYNNGEIVVKFNSCLCNNAGKCTQDVSKVIKFSKLPWVNSSSARTRRMIEHISKCPSGALHYDFVKS